MIVEVPLGSAAGGGASPGGQTPLELAYIPTEGQTIDLPDVDREIVVNLAPLTDLNELTINLPENSPGRVGQRLFISSTKQIANVTCGGGLTVNNPTVMFSPGDNVVFFRNEPNTWSRLIG